VCCYPLPPVRLSSRSASELPFSTAVGSPWARSKASTHTKPRGVQSGSALRLADSDDVRPWYRWRGWSVCTRNQVRGWQREKAVRRQRNWRGYMMPEGIDTWFVRSARPLHSLERASRHDLWETPDPLLTPPSIWSGRQIDTVEPIAATLAHVLRHQAAGPSCPARYPLQALSPTCVHDS
jgi:hypothetical protein